MAALPHKTPGGKKLKLCLSNHQGVSQEVVQTPDDRMKHTFILGQTGTGKSTLMESMILQDIDAGHGVAVIDPHGDLVDPLLGKIPKERSRDVVYFDFEKIMNAGKILLIKMGKGRFGPVVSGLLTNQLVAKFKLAAMQRGEMPADKRRDFFLYVDEQIAKRRRHGISFMSRWIEFFEKIAYIN